MARKFIITDTTTLPFETAIQGQEARHIHKVMRLKPGDTLCVTDGAGHDYQARIILAAAGRIDIKVFEALESRTESPLPLTLCSAMLKDKNMDLVIRHVTQLGIREWIPFFSQRAVPRPDRKKLSARLKRWQTIADESMKQCGRSNRVQIHPPVPFDTLMDLSTPFDLKIAFWEQAHRPLSDLTGPSSSILILIGPEGGFSKEEIKTAETCGFNSFSLGPRILRAETAAITAAALVQHHLGDL